MILSVRRGKVSTSRYRKYQELLFNSDCVRKKRECMCMGCYMCFETMRILRAGLHACVLSEWECVHTYVLAYVCVSRGGGRVCICVLFVCEYMCSLSDRVFAKFGYELITCSNAVIGER